MAVTCIDWSVTSSGENISISDFVGIIDECIWLQCHYMTYLYLLNYIQVSIQGYI